DYYCHLYDSSLSADVF
nr:immunoglobulin light chain junction region [Macaca mulatta]MOW04628.1 immunoglobulin light chain junction region [Macaca mulatta]MOW05246.1 immunoglobulin light chain junction region [Macaca mulatta]MOW05749.1 immunoglobulin light chain junction region [Macaca mulatta]MOW05801.1 immunoglobulin light chain junction region [Macaca mulatta]